MDMKSYQRQALATDRVPQTSENVDATSLIVPMLGLAGETGQLLSEYKKYLRDGAAHKLFKERVSEELGDLLWYVANVASKFNLDLDQIAAANLNKIGARWSENQPGPPRFDKHFPEQEQLPRLFEVELTEVVDGDRRRVQFSMNGEVLGATLTDNAYDSDGYRFHDVFHLAYASVLGWSPVTRAILGRKRKSQPLLDEVEDGGRAAVIEEGIAALAFSYARSHQFLEGVTTLDYSLLRTIQSMTAHLEVRRCTTGDWEQAILLGFATWRKIVRNGGGKVLVNLDERTIGFAGAVAQTPNVPVVPA